VIVWPRMIDCKIQVRSCCGREEEKKCGWSISRKRLTVFSAVARCHLTLEDSLLLPPHCYLSLRFGRPKMMSSIYKISFVEKRDRYNHRDGGIKSRLIGRTKVTASEGKLLRPAMTFLLCVVHFLFLLLPRPNLNHCR
jgi:hypothetical protein